MCTTLLVSTDYHRNPNSYVLEVIHSAHIILYRGYFFGSLLKEKKKTEKFYKQLINAKSSNYNEIAIEY